MTRTFSAIYIEARERRGARVRFLTRKPGEVLVSGADWCRAIDCCASTLINRRRRHD